MKLKAFREFVLPNQMDRQSAVQDIIDASQVDLLADVTKAPVSAFKMRAFKLLLNDEQLEAPYGIELVKRMIIDHPQEIIVLHHYEDAQDPAFLINELFCPDFSRCYLAMQSCCYEWPTHLASLAKIMV